MDKMSRVIYHNVLNTEIQVMDRKRVEMMAEIYKNGDDFRTQSSQSTDGWKEYQSSLYFISSEKKSWSDSRRYCRRRGADLISINNHEERDFIEKISVENKHWIGLSDIDVEGRWKWVDGSTPSYGFWHAGEPNSGRTENCALKHWSLWADYPCNEAYNYFCEKNNFK
nr:perlucin-like protein isoform X2 [Misgurnus anguillicaudatus]